MDLLDLARLAERAGLTLRGGFNPTAQDAVPCADPARPARSLILLGLTSPASWKIFAASREARDGHAHPLDRWSRRTISEIAAEVGASALFPFDGPPWLPFQRWARRAEPVFVSPLGILIHPDLDRKSVV